MQTEKPERIQQNGSNASKLPICSTAQRHAEAPTLMFCHRCGFPHAQQFCPHCGHRQCVSCGDG